MRSLFSRRPPAARSFRRAVALARHATQGAGALALLVVLVACSPAEPPAAQVPERVAVQIAAYAPVSRTISLTGTVAARIQSDLSFRVAGRIDRRNVDVSDHVKAGDVLATLDTREQVSDVEAAEATLRSAEATLTQAQTNFGRQRRLFEGGYITRGVFDDAQEQLRSAEGTADSARADLATARDQLSFTELKADVDGIVTAREAEAGQVVSAAQTVFTVAQDGARDAIFDIDEALLAGAPPSEGVVVRLGSDPAVETRASVREVSPTFDAATGTVRVKMTLADPPPAMSLGAAVTGTGLAAPQNLVSLPWTALGAGESGPAVWVVDPATKAVTLRPVGVERYRTGEILVRDGLSEGDLVVTAGGQLLREGQVVTLDDAGAAS
ncbi:efflux RND transporter periplasmic adaptor subunit [Aureimonas pseudogalii]|uniref:RND family efflux transporter MFP subunit n=1 Tax=Aureimonas pseudogalii TaxID=1744844 RepID=A0A7W6H6H5_9HYPH|nr:efflux RND transporter periplasmic adaptor subunit [Aureimonas pseudogalii]MBB3999472.1 RND family efflux transporter MFP subunit [Aureimonas pseudogalii]